MIKFRYMAIHSHCSNDPCQRWDGCMYMYVGAVYGVYCIHIPPPRRIYDFRTTRLRATGKTWWHNLPQESHVSCSQSQSYKGSGLRVRVGVRIRDIAQVFVVVCGYSRRRGAMAPHGTSPCAMSHKSELVCRRTRTWEYVLPWTRRL